MFNKRLDFEPRWLIVILFFLGGLFFGGLAVYTAIFNNQALLQKIHSAPSSQYRLINPLLAVDTAPGGFFEDKTLESRLDKVISRSKANHSLDSAGVYFREFETGRWAGINEDTVFSFGKLLKIPMMIAYYRAAEDQPTLLAKKISYKGNMITISELINQMVAQNSDDIAGVLFDNMSLNAINEVYSDLGINFKEDKVNLDYISLKSYALFFRILYNATYLNRQYSEKALDQLAQTVKNNGISAPLPNDLTIAHKYVVNSIKNGIEIDDCGIVYYPSYPYLMCVVATGKSQVAINGFIFEASQTVYSVVDERYKNLTNNN